MTNKGGGVIGKPGLPETDIWTFPGILLLTPSLDTVAYNWEAAQILAFPSDPRRIKRLSAFLTGRIRSKLSTDSFTQGQQFVSEFKSGTRTYLCRAVNLYSGKTNTATTAMSTAVLLERQASPAISMKRRIWREFGLTQRERQTVELLLMGMTTKQIAFSMKISPNTTKTYLRLIMTKMKVKTRTGIIGKAFTM